MKKAAAALKRQALPDLRATASGEPSLDKRHGNGNGSPSLDKPHGNGEPSPDKRGRPRKPIYGILPVFKRGGALKVKPKARKK